MKTPGQRIQHLRKEIFKVTQEVMGSYAGVSKAAVSSWEREMSEPERDALQNLKNRKNINPDWITSGIEPVFLDNAYGLVVMEQAHQYRPSDKAMEIAWAAEALPGSVQKHLLELIRSMKAISLTASPSVDLEGIQEEEHPAKPGQKNSKAG